MEDTISQNTTDSAVVPPSTPQEEVNSSNKIMWVILGFIVLIAVIITGVFLFLPKSAKNVSTSATQQNQSIASPTPANLSNVSATGTTNAQLDKDLNTVDADLNSLDADVGAVDQGLNDQQTNLQ